MPSAWPQKYKKRIDVGSAGFRWSFRIIGLVGLAIIAYQLSYGDFCTGRAYGKVSAGSGRITCSTGASAWWLAGAFASGCVGVIALSIPRQWGYDAAKVCAFLFCAGFIGAVVANLLT